MLENINTNIICPICNNLLNNNKYPLDFVISKCNTCLYKIYFINYERTIIYSIEIDSLKHCIIQKINNIYILYIGNITYKLEISEDDFFVIKNNKWHELIKSANYLIKTLILK